MSYYVTFGQKYAREPHEVLGSWAVHPSGFVRVRTDDEGRARELAIEHLGTFWAFLYTDDTMNRQMYPMGELGVISDRGIMLLRDLPRGVWQIGVGM